MPMYQNPTFVPKVQPDQALVAPTSPGNPLAQGILDAGKVFSQYYNDSLDRALQNKKIQGQEYTNQYTQANTEKAKADTDKAKADAAKAMQDAITAKQRADALNDYIAQQEAGNAQTATTPPEISTPDNGINIPVPQGTEKKQSRNIENDIENDPTFQAAKKAADFSLHIDKSLNPSEYTGLINKARKEVARDHISTEFANQVDAQQPTTREEASAILRSIPGTNRYLANADQEELLKSFEKKSDIEKSNEIRNRENRIVAQQDVTNKRAQDQLNETKAQNISTAIGKVSDDMKDITPTISSLKSVNDALANAPGDITSTKFGNAFKALKAKISLEGNDQNILQGLASYIIGFDPSSKKARELKLWLDTNEGQKAVNSEEFRNVMLPIMGLLNNYTKTISGSAVSSGESLRTQGAFSVDPLSSPENLVASLRQIEKETRARTKNATSSLRRDNNSYSQYREQGGLGEEDIPTLFGAKATVKTPIIQDHSADRESRKTKDNPLGLKL